MNHDLKKFHDSMTKKGFKCHFDLSLHTKEPIAIYEVKKKDLFGFGHGYFTVEIKKSAHCLHKVEFGMIAINGFEEVSYSLPMTALTTTLYINNKDFNEIDLIINTGKKFLDFMVSMGFEEKPEQEGEV